MTDLPPGLTLGAAEIHGAAGRAWLAGLPALLSELAARWALDLAPPFPRLSYNYVAPARRGDGTVVVLKLGFTGDREFATEAEALWLFAGRGCVRLLETDVPRGALLLEVLRPGTSLGDDPADDAAATSVVCAALRALGHVVPAPDHPFPTTADWAAGLARLRARFAGGTGPLPPALVDRAERLFAELHASAASPRLLHGDLHHGNVLAAQRRPWLAIDPKGVVGEAAYDAGAFLRNPLPAILRTPAPGRFLARRLDQLAEELGLPRQRLQAWGLAQAVLSAWWMIEDHGAGWEPAAALAERLAALPGV